MAKRKLTLTDFTGPNNINTPDPSNSYGIADRDALQAFAWNQEYDVDARRNAIAAALLAKQVAAPGAAAAPGFDQLTAMPNDYRFGGSGDYGMGSGDSAAPTGQTPGNVTQQGFFENATPERSFTQGQPPGPTMFGRDRESAPPGSREEDATVADIMDQVAQANAIAQAMSQTTPTPNAPAPSNAPTLSNAPTPSNAPAPTGTPALYGDPFTPGGVPPSGNLFEGPGFISPTGATPAAPTGFPGEHSDIPGATPSAPSSSGGLPAGGSFAGAGQTGVVAGGGSAALPGGGAILSTDASKGWGGMMNSPGRAPSSEGEKEADKEADPNAPDYTPAFDFANAMASPTGGVPGGPTPGFAGLPGGVPGGLPGATPGTPGSVIAEGTPGAMSFGGRGGANAALSQTAGAMVSPGLPSPGGGVFSPGFSFTAPAPAAEMDFGSTPAFDVMGNPTGWSGSTAPGAVDLGDLSGQGAVDAAGLTDTGPGGGMSEGAAAAASEAGASAAAAAAGGSAGFGGMGAGGGVGPGGMSTGGTGEVGSVADPGGFGPGGFSGNAASEAGGFSGFGSGGFDPGTGDTTGSGDTTGAGDTTGW